MLLYRLPNKMMRKHEFLTPPVRVRILLSALLVALCVMYDSTALVKTPQINYTSEEARDNSLKITGTSSVFSSMVTKAEDCAYVSYYYQGGTGEHYWTKMPSGNNIWAFLCSFQRLVGSKCPLVMLVDPEVSDTDIKAILSYGAKIVYMRKLPLLDPRQSSLLSSSLAYHFSKLAVWSLTEYGKIVFLDLDAWPVEDITSIFEISVPHQGVAAGNWSSFSPWKFNSGVMLLQPSDLIYGKLMSSYVFGKWNLSTVHENGDQTFLGQLLNFDELPYRYNVKYPKIQNVLPSEAKIIHNFIEKKQDFLKWAKDDNRMLKVLGALESANSSYCPTLSLWLK